MTLVGFALPMWSHRVVVIRDNSVVVVVIVTPLVVGNHANYGAASGQFPYRREIMVTRRRANRLTPNEQGMSGACNIVFIENQSSSPHTVVRWRSKLQKWKQLSCMMFWAPFVLDRATVASRAFVMAITWLIVVIKLTLRNGPFRGLWFSLGLSLLEMLARERTPHVERFASIAVTFQSNLVEVALKPALNVNDSSIENAGVPNDHVNSLSFPGQGSSDRLPIGTQIDRFQLRFNCRSIQRLSLGYNVWSANVNRINR